MDQQAYVQVQDHELRTKMHAAFPKIAHDYAASGQEWMPDTSVTDAYEVLWEASPMVEWWLSFSRRDDFPVKEYNVAIKEEGITWFGVGDVLPPAMCRACLAWQSSRSRCLVPILAR